MFKFPDVLVQIILCCLPFFAFTQDLIVNIDIEAVGNDRFSVCGGERPVNLSVENISGQNLSDVLLTLDLSSVAGIEYTGNISGSDANTITYDAGASTPATAVFNLPDLADGDLIEFAIGLEALCAAVPLSGSGGNPNFDLNFAYTGGTGSQAENSGNFEVVKPAFTVFEVIGNPVEPPLVKTGTSASLFDAVLFETDSLTVRVVNGGNGSADSYIYYVIDHPDLDLQRVMIGTHELPFIGMSNDTLFYEVGPAAVAQAVPDATSPPDDNTLFQFNEVMTFREIWTVTNCDTEAPDLVRGAAFGCGDSVYDLCEGGALSSGLRYGFIRPQLHASSAWGQLTEAERAEGLPACYAEEIVTQRFWIYNSGGAAAKNIKFNLSNHHSNQSPSVLLANNTKISIGKHGVQTTLTPAQTYTQNNNYGDCSNPAQIMSADYDLSDIDYRLPAGDTLWIEFQTDYVQCGCDNGTTVCHMNDYYHNLLNWRNGNLASLATYDDLCELNTYEINQVSSTNYRSFLTSLFESPATISNAQEQTASLTISNGQNSWLNDFLNSGRTRYERGIYRLYITMGEGLDWKGNAGDLDTPDFTWLLNDGAVWKPSQVDYLDNQGGDDVLYLEFSFADFPESSNASTGFTTGMKLSFNVVGDCIETGPECMRGGVAQIQTESFFSPDADCTDCGDGNYVDCIQTTDLQIKCPTCEECEGINPVSLELLRKNYGLADNDNDRYPDDGGSIDSTRVARNRLISGDTLLVKYAAVIGTSADIPSFAGAFSQLQLPTEENLTFLPQGARLRIKKADGTTYEAGILQQIPDGNLLLTNLSFNNLHELGNNVPAAEVYEQGDSIFLEVDILIEDPDFVSQNEVNNFRDITIEDRSFASPQTSWFVEPEDRYACDDIRQRFYYVEQIHRTDWIYNDRRGGCDPLRSGEYQRWVIGGFSLDYFPFEYRSPKGILEKTVLYKAPGLEFDRVLWRIGNKRNQTVRPVGEVPLQGGAVYGTLESPHAPGSLRIDGQIPLSSPYVSVVGDTITIFSGAFMRQNFGEILADEGILSAFSIQMKAGCGSGPVRYNVQGEGLIYPQNTWTLNPKVFGYSELEGGRIARPPSEPQNHASPLVYEYQGGAELLLQTPLQTNLLTGEVACFQAEILNFTDYTSEFTFFSVENESGAVIVESVTNISDPDNPVAITPGIGGIYPLGSMAAAGASPASVLLEICVRSNNCLRDSLVFNAGTDCEAYPISPAESSCAAKSTVYLEPTEAELGMVIRRPEAPVEQDLCADQEYIIEISSAKLGHLSNIELFFNVPDGQEYLSGTFEIAYPLTSADPDQAVFTDPGIDPTEIYGNSYRINVSSLHPVLATTGLPGTGQPGQNLLFVKFRTKTDCNFLSGGKVRFLSRAENSCGQPTNRRYSPASAIEISGAGLFYSTQINLSDAVINPCSDAQTTFQTSFRLRSDSAPTTSADSVLIVLAPGLAYVPGSLVNFGNAVETEPVITLDDEVQKLIWPVQVGLTAGDEVQFSFTTTAADVGQNCDPYRITATTFSSREDTCIDPFSVCSVREISSETEAVVNFVKPELFVANFTGSLTFSAPNEEILDYAFTIENTGASVPNGQTTTVQIVADLDNDGEFSAADAVLGTVETTSSVPSQTSLELVGTVNIPAGQSCSLLAVINPEVTCACEISPSFRLQPQLTVPFDKAPSVCSDVPVDIGPAPAAAYAYEWVSVGGSEIASLDPTDDTPTVFRQRNLSTETAVVRYGLRIERGDACLSYDTVTISVFPEEFRRATTEVCRNTAFTLTGPDNGSNFMWTPTDNLDDPTAKNPNVSGLTEPIVYSVVYTDANGCEGTAVTQVNLQDCADTGLGDLVWWDIDYDGIYDVGEPGVPGVTVWLVNPANPTVPLLSTVTDAAGNYYFDPLPAADYQVLFVQNEEMTFTLADAGGDDAADSDANPLTGYSHDAYIFNGLQDSTFDAGIIYLDFGDLPDGGAQNGYFDYLTANGADVPHHLIIPGLSLGTVVDGEHGGQASPDAGGDDNDAAGDDEDGLGTEDGASWTLGTTVDLPLFVTNTTGETAYLKGWIDWNGDGDFDDPGELVTDLSGTTFPTSLSIDVPYDVPAGRTIGVRYRLGLEENMTETGFVRSGEIEDYLVDLTCPPVAAPLSTGNRTACTNESLVELSVQPNADFVTDWYTNAAGGTPVATASNTYTPPDYGTYYAEARAAENGCVSMQRTAISLTPLDPPTINSITADGEITCTNNPVLSATVTPTGGDFAWTGPGIVGDSDTENITVESAGDYILQYTATNGCAVVDTVTATEDLTQPGAEAGPDKEVNCAEPTVVLEGSSPTADATYAWTTDDGNIVSGAATAAPTVDRAGIYSLETTHPVTGCTSTDVVTVTRPPDLTAASAVSPQLRCDNPDGSIDVTVNSGTAPISFAWSDGATTEDRSGLSHGTYTVTLTDAKGCTLVLSPVILDESPSLSLTAAAACEAAGSNYNLEVQLAYSFSQGSDVTVTLETGESRTLTLPVGSGTVTAEFLSLSNVGESDITVTATYAEDAGCTEVIDYDAPEICCQIYAPIFTTECDDNRTPNRPEDDLWTYRVTPQGVGTSGTASITGDDNRTGLVFDTENGPFGPFAAQNGNLTVTMTDENNSGCFLENIIIEAQTCSDAEVDYGDLPDSYGTSEQNDGPRHVIIDGLKLGENTDGENDGTPSDAAGGDGSDEDGLLINDAVDFIPGSTVSLPIVITNTTGEPSYTDVWIDWNGNGTFEPEERIADLSDENEPYPAFITVVVPPDAVQNQNLGVRVRVSQEDNMMPTGLYYSGEVEDYLIRSNCEVICPPVELIKSSGNP